MVMTQYRTKPLLIVDSEIEKSFKTRKQTTISFLNISDLVSEMLKEEPMDGTEI
jgi:hypothetical protein